jgi:2'-5' RNA ligase
VADRERLFFALWPDETLRRQLVRRMARDLRPCGGRRIPPENLHVTLVFLGTLDARQRCRLELAAETVPERAFILELVEWVYWRRSRIVNCSMEFPPAALSELVQGLRHIGRECGARVESRAFLPHLTVMRKAQRAPTNGFGEPLSWHVKEYHLVRSQTLPEGAVYESVRSWPLQE